MSDYFPLEVIVEILQRLPLKSLVRCMCVCKEWKSIITDHAFCISHNQLLQSNPANSSLFFHLPPSDDYSPIQCFSLYSDDDATDSLSVLEFPPFYTSGVYWRVVCTCNGLVCFAGGFDQAVIWNPSIHKYFILPKPSLTFTFETPPRYKAFYGLGLDSRSHDFKVVRIVCSADPKISPQVEIYSLSAHSWRSITVAALPFDIASDENKFVNGLLHWLAYREINGMRNYFILMFDVVEDKFGELMLPEGLQSQYEVSILRGGNLLALDHMRYGQFRIIWVMKEYGVVDSWTKLFHFYSTSENYLLGWPGVSALRNNEEVVLLDHQHDKIAFLDPIKGLVKEIGHSCYIISFMGDHVESLFLINDKNAKTLPSTLILP